MKKLLLMLGVGMLAGLGVSTAVIVYLPVGATLTERYAAAVEGEGGEEADTTGLEALAMGDALLEAEAATTLDTGSNATRAAVDPYEDLAGDAAGGAAEGPPSEGGPAMAPGTAVTPPAAPPVPAGIDADRLAKMFGSMPSRDAARVLDHLDDAEVGVILGKLGNREAAAILGSLDPERAALISRTVIRGERRSP